MRTTLGHVRSLICEAKSSVKDARKLNHYSEKDVRFAAAKNSLIYVKELVKTQWYLDKFGANHYHLYVTIEKIGNVPRIQIRFYKQATTRPHPGISGDILVSFGDVFLPKIGLSGVTLRKMVSHASAAGWDDWQDDIQKIKSDLKEIVGPRPAEGQLWWADESMYPIRPLLEGESPHLRPDPTWIVIDINTHEEWMDGKGYDDDAVPY